MFAPWADDAIYTPPGRAAIPVQVLLDRGTRTLVTEAGEVIEAEDRITFLSDEVSTPVRDSIVVIGSTSWLLCDLIERKIDSDGAGTVTMEAREQ
jgi:hypothetical protein